MKHIEYLCAYRIAINLTSKREYINPDSSKIALIVFIVFIYKKVTDSSIDSLFLSITNCNFEENSDNNLKYKVFPRKTNYLALIDVSTKWLMLKSRLILAEIR